MSYGLLWLASIAYSLLIVATITAIAARCKKPLWRRLWPILTAIIAFIPLTSFAVSGGLLLKNNLQPKWLFWYGVSQSLAYIISTIIILKNGLKGSATDLQNAKLWPRLRLAVAFGVAVFIFITVLNMVDMRIMINLINLKTEAESKISMLLPPHLSETDNAYDVYERAAEALGQYKDLPEWFRDSDRPDFNPTANKVAQFLENNKNAIELIHRAASMPDYSIRVDITNFYEWPIPNFIRYRNFAKLLSLSSRSKSLAGDTHGVLQDLKAIRGMAEHLISFPTLISLMNSIAVDKTRIKTLEYVLAHTSVARKGLSDLPVAVYPSILKNLRNVMRLEAEGQLQGLAKIALKTNVRGIFGQNPDDKIGCYAQGSTIPTKLWRVFFLPSDLKAARDIIAENLWKPVKTYEELQKNLKKIDQAKEAGEFGILASIAAPNFLRFVTTSMRYDVLIGLSNLARAASAYKARTGDYPTRPENLVPIYLDKIPIDPFTGDSLKIKKVEKGLDLFNLGPGPEFKADKKGPIHFYLGRKVYNEYRVKPIQKN
jgi:predicted nucleic acid-binding OB-fold protein